MRIDHGARALGGELRQSFIVRRNDQVRTQQKIDAARGDPCRMNVFLAVPYTHV